MSNEYLRRACAAAARAAVCVAVCVWGSVARAQDDAASRPAATADDVRTWIAELAEAKDFDARFEAARNLAYAGAVAGPELPALMALARGKDAELAGWAVWIIGELGPDVAGAAVEPLTDLLEKQRAEGRMTGSLIKALIALKAPPQALRASVAVALKRPKDPESREVGENWPSDLWEFDPTGERSLPLVKLLLEKGESSQARWSLRDLWRYADGASLAPDLIAAVERFYPAKGRSQIPGAHDAEELDESFRKGDPAMQSGRRKFRPHDEKRVLDFECEPLRTLADFGAAARGSVAAVARLAETGSPAVRADAVRALAEIDVDGAVALKAARALLKDPTPPRRSAAADALRRLGAKAAPARAELVAAMPAARPYELRAIVAALGAIDDAGPPPTAGRRAEWISLAKSKKADAKTADAVVGLGRATPGDDAVAALKPLLDAKEPWLACLAIEALGRQGRLAAGVAPQLTAVVAAMGVKEPEVELWPHARVAYALRALGEIGDAGEATLAAVDRIVAAAVENSTVWMWHGTLAGLDEDAAALVRLQLKPDPRGRLETTVVDRLEVPSPRFAEWYQQHPDRGAVVGVVRDAEGGYLFALKDGGPTAQWSSGESVHDAFNQGMLLRLVRGSDGSLAAHAYDPSELTPRKAREGEEARKPLVLGGKASAGRADFDRDATIAVTFEVTVESADKEEPGTRFRGSFLLPNPWRQRR